MNCSIERFKIASFLFYLISKIVFIDNRMTQIRKTNGFDSKRFVHRVMKSDILVESKT